VRILFIVLVLLFTGCADIKAYDAQLADKDAQIAKLQSELVTVRADYEKLKTETADRRPLRYFDTYNEMIDFLRKDKTNEIKYIKETFDCDDFAFTLCKNAAREGYLIHPYPTTDGHVECFTIADTKSIAGIFLIEPQTDAIAVFGTVDRY
jgi:hypothetical protein